MDARQILTEARIGYETFAGWRFGGVYLSAALQLLGSYADLKKFQASHREYFRWEAHHIVETQDFGRLGVQAIFPGREGQLCVLLPKAAHRSRVNSALRHSNPAGVAVDFSTLKAGYAQAYALVGNYCGGGERAIRRELLAIVDTIFRISRRS
jgi:hypothetical protein